MTTISNTWITLEEQRNGVTVQRKFAGLNTFIDSETDEVKYCIIHYWERELYPNNNVIKTELKKYVLTDLEYSEVVIGGQTYYMEALPVLSGFIDAFGQRDIVDASRETLISLAALPLDAVDGYILRRDTREKHLKS
jgi:hypothetical protein